MAAAPVVIDADELDSLIGALIDLGYRTWGPVVRDEAIVPGPVAGLADLPTGCHDVQEPGLYRLEHADDEAVFGWAVGPGSWKAQFFPPREQLWRATADGEIAVTEPPGDEPPVAVVGARPCELVAMSVLDRVLQGGTVADARYAARRHGTFVVAAECSTPAATCFCTSMDSGPHAESNFDLALSELLDGEGHRFVVRTGSERGSEVLSRLRTHEASDGDLAARDEMLASARRAITREMPSEGVPALLARNLEHPRWDEVAERCLACGNCTLVCPTCFCSDVRDTTTLAGEVRRERSWASCFDLDHSYLSGGHVRASTRSRYRQWLTHKLSTWWDQFGTSGCVGCGRCIAWCPVGIDLTEEVEAVRTSDGALRVADDPGGHGGNATG